ncbi:MULTISPECIES: hypothetical protein [Pseudomonas syringae group]|uniref:Uncharacterized protein n=4 Tax=Pseudomonas syringae group TaxID=136849 RepID=F3GGU6_PSESJ|nr:MULTISPECIES: hypothetical protein [Pseudomonas syringae group]EGH46296.1 hypothetical protein PSYPI_29909 [Pseudomonas syringae pv. pisi str. 1704B]RMU76039.1 hypothetical protein ALP24_200072 [Pseudomonas syringae pv. aptata]AZG89280.1 hypothetical protein N032_27350 [Pseudomonas syringae pv. pisi str. PP1]PYD08052.1 hypothetical protein DND62_29000 [Pseudomonas syringae pv. pisi]PYD24243.1 hypothetical protein DND58_28510 [Pseudomonas syringae pv. pisi]
MLKARMALVFLLVLGSAALWGNTPRDLLNLAIVLVTPPLIIWLILRPTKAEKAVQGKAAE